MVYLHTDPEHNETLCQYKCFEECSEGEYLTSSQKDVRFLKVDIGEGWVSCSHTQIGEDGDEGKEWLFANSKVQ